MRSRNTGHIMQLGVAPGGFLKFPEKGQVHSSS